jgi:hypothetical protein
MEDRRRQDSRRPRDNVDPDRVRVRKSSRDQTLHGLEGDARQPRVDAATTTKEKTRS